jgi:hypothetical protein
MSDTKRSKNTRDNKIKFIYTQNNNFTIIVRKDNLFIIIKNDKNRSSPILSKWKLKQSNGKYVLESDDRYNTKISSFDIFKTIKSLPNNSINSVKQTVSAFNNLIKISDKEYIYDSDSVFSQTLNIINNMMR